MKGVGFQEKVWRPLLIKFEETQIALITGNASTKTLDDAKVSFIESLASNLNQYRKEHPGQYPEAIVQGECEAGENNVHFSTDPKGGSRSLIPKFWYLLCQAEKLTQTIHERATSGMMLSEISNRSRVATCILYDGRMDRLRRVK